MWGYLTIHGWIRTLWLLGPEPEVLTQITRIKRIESRIERLFEGVVKTQLIGTRLISIRGGGARS